jgi:hypothetical protein
VLQGVLIFLSPIVTYLTLRWARSFYVAERWRRQTRTQQRGLEVIRGNTTCREKAEVS